ncbi:MAG: MarR family transcriptional regulator [Actinomycetota bacterium]|nr:MarR family transcriptional regulator [Actinomycetota bacterium]
MAEAKELLADELHRRLHAEGFEEIRPSHGCVFRFIEPEGTRLTVLADHSALTKQAVGEVADDLERLGYVERTPDPQDGRAKLICLTPRGEHSRAAALRIMGDIEAEWAERYGADRISTMRELLEELTVQAPARAAW